MSMKVNFNLSAILSNDYLKRTDDALALSTQRLSSGYKINRAGDNPSGMAIGRRMRAQIKSLSQSSQNASDAISVVSTAEGALNEIHDMLQRLNELSIKAANGTLSGDNGGVNDQEKALAGQASTTDSIMTNSDRALIQVEVDQLIDEIERISKTTEFNGKKLLDGSFDYKGYVEEMNYPVNTKNSLADGSDKAAAALKALQSAITIESYSDEVTPGFYNVNVTLGQKYEYTYTDNFNADGTYNNTTVEKKYLGFTVAGLSVINTNDGTLATYSFHGDDKSLINVMGQRDAFINVDQRTATLKGDNGFSLTVDVDWSKLTEVVENPGFDPKDPDSSPTLVRLKEEFGDTFTAEYEPGDPGYDPLIYDATQLTPTDEGYKKLVNPDGTDYDMKDPAQKGDVVETNSISFIANLTGMGAMTEQIGPDEGTTLDMRIPKVSAKTLGISDLNLMDAESARVSITRVSNAIDRLSANRAKLGAYQNRLEHTINSLDATEESMTSAFSRIMDTDMAEEMTIYSQQQVMSQAGTSMLAQANQRPSQILQLLQ